MRVPWSDREWRRVLVYGMGKSGWAAARFLTARGVHVVAVDDRPAADLAASSPEDPGALELWADGSLERLPTELDGMVVSPGVPLDRPLVVEARERGLPVIGEIELAFPFVEGPIAAVTGSNGKSTTTALAGHLLESSGRRAVVTT